VHLDAGTFQIHQAMDRGDDEGEAVKATKMNEVRDLLIEPNIVPLLRALHAETGGKGRVIARHPHRSELASCLRDDLRKAGCTRAELYIDDAIRANIVYHDLRGTAATWMAIRGESAGDIQERLGHGDPQSTQLYIRRGRQLARAFGGQVFPEIRLMSVEGG
jgi:integrase